MCGKYTHVYGSSQERSTANTIFAKFRTILQTKKKSKSLRERDGIRCMQNKLILHISREKKFNRTVEEFATWLGDRSAT